MAEFTALAGLFLSTTKKMWILSLQTWNKSPKRVSINPSVYPFWFFHNSWMVTLYASILKEKPQKWSTDASFLITRYDKRWHMEKSFENVNLWTHSTTNLEAFQVGQHGGSSNQQTHRPTNAANKHSLLEDVLWYFVKSWVEFNLKAFQLSWILSLFYKYTSLNSKNISLKKLGK